MNTIVKMTEQMLTDIHADLDRRHEFALERVGFVACGAATLSDDGLILYARGYHPVADEDYEASDDTGATIDGTAFRKIFGVALHAKVGLFHVHRHDHCGPPRPSRIDTREYAKFLPDFFNVRPEMPHGALILSLDRAWGTVLVAKHGRLRALDALEIVGTRVRQQ